MVMEDMMDRYKFEPSAMYINNLLDCRRLTLSLSFYQMDQDRVLELGNQLFQWLFDITGTDFIYDCSYGMKHTNIGKFSGQLIKKFDPIRGMSAGFDAYKVSPIVYNLESLRKYRRFAIYNNPGNYQREIPSDTSADYPKFVDQIFSHWRPNFEEIPEMAYQIFCEPNRKMISYHLDSDLRFSIDANSYTRRPDYYYGKARISFSTFCLGNGVDSMANDMAQFLIQLVEKHTKINAHIGLQPKDTSPYMQYFGSELYHDGSHKDTECSVHEWYPTYYLCDIAWMNILSPLSKLHILPITGTIEGVDVEELSCGGILVKSKKVVTQYDVTDAYALKKLLLPALYPGRSSRLAIKHWFNRESGPRVYSWCPRNDWAIVPIDKNEIKVYGTEMVYASQNIFEIK